MTDISTQCRAICRQLVIDHGLKISFNDNVPDEIHITIEGHDSDHTQELGQPIIRFCKDNQLGVLWLEMHQFCDDAHTASYESKVVISSNHHILRTCRDEHSNKSTYEVFDEEGAHRIFTWKLIDGLTMIEELDHV